MLFERISELIKSTEWKHRHAALMAISQSGEGCQSQMARQLEQIVGMIVQVVGDDAEIIAVRGCQKCKFVIITSVSCHSQHFADPHPRVRWAAINTVGQMSTDFGPELQASYMTKR